MRVRARIVRTKGHVQAVDNPLNISGEATIRTQRGGNWGPSVSVEIPPPIAEQATRLAVWMSTQSFVGSTSNVRSDYAHEMSAFPAVRVGHHSKAWTLTRRPPWSRRSKYRKSYCEPRQRRSRGSKRPRSLGSATGRCGAAGNDYEEFGYDRLFDRRRGKPSPKRVPVKTVEQVLGLYGEEYFDFNVQHFHEKLQRQARS